MVYRPVIHGLQACHLCLQAYHLCLQACHLWFTGRSFMFTSLSFMVYKPIIYGLSFAVLVPCAPLSS